MGIVDSFKNVELNPSQERETLAAALIYRKMGFSVIPLVPRGKKPVIPSWSPYQTKLPTKAELREWFYNDKGYNLGIVTGRISGLTVVDFDTPEAVQLAKEKGFPVTPLVKTGNGYHAYCRYEDGHRNFQKRADLPGIDLRGEGGYVVAPPSIHSNGMAYEWVKGKGAAKELELAEVPELIIAESDEDRTSLDEVFKGVTEGNRNESLAKVAGYVIAKGDSFEDARQFCLTWNTRNSPPLPDKEVESTVRSIFLRHQKNRTVLSVLSVPDSENPENFGWPDPLPLPDILPPVKSLDPDMIPIPLQGWLMDIADRMQIPPDFSTAAAVVALGSIIGRGCGIYPKRHDDWLVIPNLWGAVVGALP